MSDLNTNLTKVSNDPVKNNLDFTNITVPAYNLFAIFGNIKQRMPDFKNVIEQGYKIGNYRDFATRQMEEYNPNTNDRNILNNNMFTLVGNPTIGDPEKSCEQIIINDLEQKVFKSLKLKILNINPSTRLTSCSSLQLARNKEKAKAIYEEIKTKGLPYITILSPEQVKKLDYYNYALPEVREKILEGLFQGNLTEKKDYITHIKTIKQAKDISQLFSYSPGGFTGTRFIRTCSIYNSFPYASSRYDFDNSIIFLAVNSIGTSAPIATAKKS